MTISAAAVSTPAAAEHPARAMLLVGALGVVFGDIGTSPIYAFRKSLRAAGGAELQANRTSAACNRTWVLARDSVRHIEASDDHAVDRRFDVAAMSIVGVARQAPAGFNRLGAPCQDRDAVPAFCPCQIAS